MSISKCLQNELDKLDPVRAQRVLKRVQELELVLSHKMERGAARAAAEDEIMRQLAFEASESRRQLVLRARATRRITADLETYRGKHGQQDLSAAAVALMEGDQLSTFSSLSGRRDAILGRLHGRMDQALATFRRNLAGQTRNKATLTDMVREMFGEATGNKAAREMASAWSAAAEFARLKFNAAGGRIAKLKDWGLPQLHDALRVKRVSVDDWIETIMPRLNIGKMIDRETGRAFEPDALRAALRETYQAIVTDGWSRRTPTHGGGPTPIANRRLDHRFMVFKTADDWLAYQKDFGAADPFSVMIGHLDLMARDIAQMEVLGPHPQAMLRFVDDLVRKDAALKDAAGGAVHSDQATTDLDLMRTMFDEFTGANSAPINGAVGRSFASLRSFLTSVQLGSAFLAALSDINFSRMARKFAGLPQTRALSDALKLMRPDRIEDQRLAVRLGLIAENWSSVGAAQLRYVGEISGGEISQRLSDGILRASFLSPWTQAGKWAFGMEFLGTLADNAGRSFDDLDAALQRTFARYGLEADDWDVIRATKLYEHEGVGFLRPDDIAARGDLDPLDADRLASRVLEMISAETEFAVPSASLRGRSTLVGNTKSGSVPGEIMRSAMMYKNFAVTMYFTHVRRGLLQETGKAKAAYFSEFAITTTLMGALALQLKEISKGRDPRDMTDERFWAAAAMQGGGLAIFGDFFFSSLNRFDKGLAETIAGPIAGFANDTLNLTAGNVVELVGGEDTNLGRELIAYAKRYTPGSSLWQSRLAMERLFWDRLELMVDPDAASRMRRRERKRAREYGQDYFWAPGDLTPERAPELLEALGE